MGELWAIEEIYSAKFVRPVTNFVAEGANFWFWRRDNPVGLFRKCSDIARNVRNFGVGQRHIGHLGMWVGEKGLKSLLIKTGRL